VLERHAHVHALEEAWDDRHLEAEPLALPDQRQQQPVGCGAEAEHHVARAGLLRHARELRRSAQYGGVAVRRHVRGRRVRVQIAHRKQPELRLPQQSALDVRPDLAGTDDQGGLGDQPVHPRVLLLPVEQHAGAREVRGPEQPSPRHERGRFGAGIEEGRERDQRDRGERRGGHDLAEPVHDPRLDRVLVEPS
jgi:hypothetical protein